MSIETLTSSKAGCGSGGIYILLGAVTQIIPSQFPAVTPFHFFALFLFFATVLSYLILPFFLC